MTEEPKEMNELDVINKTLWVTVVGVWRTREFQYLVELADGKEMIFGSTRDFMSQQRWRERLFEVAGAVMGVAPEEAWNYLLFVLGKHTKDISTRPSIVGSDVRSVDDLVSPVGAFVRDCCEMGPEHWSWMDDIYAAWMRWCGVDGHTSVGSKQIFGRNLRSACPSVSTRRGTGNVRFFQGISLREPTDTNAT